MEVWFWCLVWSEFFVTTGTNVMTLNFIRCDHATIVLIIVLPIFENVFYLEKSVLSCVIFIWNFIICMNCQTCKYRLKYCILFQFIHTIWFVWRDVGCWECGMLEKWHIEHVGCWRYGDVGYVECWGFRMFRMWDIRDVGCSRYGMLEMWDVRDVECWGCEMLEMWDVWDVGRFERCSGCWMFGMLDVQDVGAFVRDISIWIQ